MPFLENFTDNIASGAAKSSDLHTLIDPFVLPYPVGLYVDGLGPLVANDAYATPEVWERFDDDRYHSPHVVWGRELNLFLLGLSRQISAARGKLMRTKNSRWGSSIRELRDDLEKTRDAFDESGLKQSELWSHRILNSRLTPERYAASCDIQLWNLTDIAVQYELDHLPK